MGKELLVFFLLGIALAVLYDVFTFFRFLFPQKACCFIIDFLYFVPAAVLTFIFLLAYNNGQSRSVYYAVMLCGFLLYILSFYRLTRVLWKALCGIIHRVFSFLWKRIKKLLQFARRMYYNIFVQPLKRRNKSKAGNSNERKQKKSERKSERKT